MRDQPFVVGGVAREAAAEMIVDAALAHAVERDGDGLEQAPLVAVAQPAAPQHLEQIGRGELRRLSEAAPHRVAFLGDALGDLVQKRERDRRAVALELDGLAGCLGTQRLQQARAVGLDLVRLVMEGLRDAAQHVQKARPAVARGMGEVGAAPERLARRRAEHGERPAAWLAQHLQRLHVDRVDIGPLLAVDLDVDEQLVHERRHFRRLEALVRHDMAPVAGGIADRQQDRPVGALGLGERRLAPRPPMHGVVGMLQQVGTGLGGQAIAALCHGVLFYRPS